MNVVSRSGLEPWWRSSRIRGGQGFFGGKAGAERVEGKMGLCARAQSLELHDRTDRSAGALAHAPTRSPRRTWRKLITNRPHDLRHTACNASPIGAFDGVPMPRRARQGGCREMSCGGRAIDGRQQRDWWSIYQSAATLNSLHKRKSSVGLFVLFLRVS